MADPAAAMQAIVDLQANMGSKARMNMPIFDGMLDTQATRTFLDLVDGYARVTRLNNEETAQAVAFAMVPGSAAAKWLANLRQRTPARAGDWDELRPLILRRFTPTLTASEKAAEVAKCRQTKNQDVQTFMDHCESVQLTLDLDMADDRKTGGQAANYALHVNEGILGLFLGGLREEGGLKSHVNAALGCTTLQEHLDAAVKYERHITKATKVAVVAELQQGRHDEASEGEDLDDLQEIANLRAKQASRRNGGKKSDGGRNSGSSNPGKGKGAAGPSGGPTRPRLCWSCQSPSHLNRDCPDKKPTPFRGGGGGGGGSSGKNGGYGAAAINEMITKFGVAGIQALMQQGTPQIQYDQQSQGERFSDINSLSYQQQQGQNFH